LRYDITIIGHIVLDYITRQSRTYGPLLGGPPVYGGIAACSLNSSVAAISKVGRDFGIRRFSWLCSQGISLTKVETVSSPTTSFRINYYDGRRIMRVVSVCETIRRDEVSEALLSRAIYLGPVIHEISRSTVEMVAESGSIVSLDPQGWLRRVLANGMVATRMWRDKSLLRKVDILKVSESELDIIMGRRVLRKPSLLSELGPSTILVTRGARGTVLWDRERGAFKIPAYKSIVRDPTGAGDALLGSFLASWIRKGDLLWATSVGSATASFIVEEIGPVSLLSRRQIERRAHKILDHIIRFKG